MLTSDIEKILPRTNWRENLVTSYSKPYTIWDTDTTNLASKQGAEYGRLLPLADGSWLSVYSTYSENGILQIARSNDNCRIWTVISTLSEEGRDLENGQMLQLPNGDILLADRSVIWFRSYRLDVFKSTDLGQSWTKISTIDSAEGAAGTLGNPDKGLYEPHMGFLDDGRIAVFYANEKHVTGSPAYSQIVSERISSDGGHTWGEEIWVAWDGNTPDLRPGMPVFTRMGDGRYIVVFEIVGLGNADIHYKISDDGVSWSEGNGTYIPEQGGAPYVLKLEDNTLVVSSSEGKLSFSYDNGSSWHINSLSPWNRNIKAWTSLYQIAADEIACVADVDMGDGENSVQVKFGIIAG